MEGTATNLKCKRDENSDRLNNLPDSLLLEILSLLNVREVAQTCILSKKWLKIWSFVPSLCFNIADFIDKDAWEVTDSVVDKFWNFVTLFLVRRNEASHIHTFRLLCNMYELGYYFNNSDETGASARLCVLYALKHNPKIIEVSLSDDYSLYLPDCFFTCETLEDVNLRLKLTHTEDIKPKKVCLPRLRNLKLSCAKFSDDYWETFLSGCPALESLSMDSCMMNNFSSHTVKQLRLVLCPVSAVKIVAPAVEILDIGVEDMETVITLKDASKVTRATISSWYHGAENVYRCNFLSSLSSVEHLLIDSTYLKGMLESELPRCPTFFKLKNLTLGGFCMGCAFDVVLSFLDHSPKLEKLTLLHTKDNICCEVDGDHSKEESDKNLELIKGFNCGLGTVEIRYCESDCTVHKLLPLILQRTRKIKGFHMYPHEAC